MSLQDVCRHTFLDVMSYDRLLKDCVQQSLNVSACLIASIPNFHNGIRYVDKDKNEIEIIGRDDEKACVLFDTESETVCICGFTGTVEVYVSWLYSVIHKHTILMRNAYRALNDANDYCENSIHMYSVKSSMSFMHEASSLGYEPECLCEPKTGLYILAIEPILSTRESEPIMVAVDSVNNYVYWRNEDADNYVLEELMREYVKSEMLPSGLEQLRLCAADDISRLWEALKRLYNVSYADIITDLIKH